MTGTCITCERVVPLRKNGTTRKHRRDWLKHRRIRCGGSWFYPEGVCMDE